MDTLGHGDPPVRTHALVFAIDLSLASNLKGILEEGECQEMKRDLTDGGLFICVLRRRG